MHHTGELFGILDIEVVDVGGGTDTGEGGDGVSGVHGGHQTQGTFGDFGQPGLGGLGVVGVVDGVGVGADEQIAVHGGAYQNALALAGGNHEQGGVGHFAAGFIHDDVLAAAGLDVDGEVVFAQNFSHFGRMHTGAVDHIPCGNGLLAVGDIINSTGMGGVGYLEVQVEIHTVGGGTFGGGDGQAVGTGDGGGGSPERHGGLSGNIGFHGPQLVLADDPQIRHTVGNPAFIQFLQVLGVFFAEPNHMGTDGFAFHAQFLCDFLHELVAAHIEAGFQGTGLCVISSVDDGGIGTGCPHGYIASGFTDGYAAGFAGKVAGGHDPGYPGTDYQYIINHQLLLAFLSSAPG